MWSCGRSCLRARRARVNLVRVCRRAAIVLDAAASPHHGEDDDNEQDHNDRSQSDVHEFAPSWWGVSDSGNAGMRATRARRAISQRGSSARPVHGRHAIFQIRTERFILGVLGPLAFGDPISESQATDRSTFCPMPGGRSQAASDAPPLRPFCLERGRQLRRLTLATAAACSSVIVGAMSVALVETRLNHRALSSPPT